MQRYNNLNECIKMCDRILRTNTYKTDSMGKFMPASEKSNYQTNSELFFLKSINAFYPSRTIIIQNFLPEAEVHVRSFVAMFGIMEICEVIKDDSLSAIAVVQYKSKTSAADALLAISNFQIRGYNLVVNLLWNGPYDNITAITASVKQSFTECSEKRVVCVGNLPRTITNEAILLKCERYGVVDDVQVRPQEQGAFVYVVFQSALSAAVAIYCLRNSTISSAALMLGYSENGSPVLLGPAKVKPLDQYKLPLSAFDVRCVCSRFLEYKRLKTVFTDFHRKLPTHYFFRPNTSEYCVRIPTTQLKGVSLFLEIILFEPNILRNSDEITEMQYQICPNKYLFRFSVDFGLHKPVMNHDERNFRPANQYVRWNSFFILDLQVSYPWAHPEPMIEPRIQGMNHLYSDIDSKAFEDGRSTSSWFGTVIRHSVCDLTSNATFACSNKYKNKMNFLLSGNLPLVGIAGSYDDINTYQIPIHIYSDMQANLKSNQSQ